MAIPERLKAFACLFLLLSLTTISAEDPPQLWEQLAPQASPEQQSQEVQGLLKRILPEHHQDFQINIDPDLAEKNRDFVRLVSCNNIGA